MKKILLYLLFAGPALLSAVSANAVTHQPAQVLSVTKSVPEQMSYYLPMLHSCQPSGFTRCRCAWGQECMKSNMRPHSTTFPPP